MEPAKLIDIALLFVLWLALSSTLLARFRLSSGWFTSAEIIWFQVLRVYSVLELCALAPRSCTELNCFDRCTYKPPCFSDPKVF